MKRGQYSVEKIISILNEIESGIPARDICRKYGFTEQTLYRWK
jgi:putative transposase